MGYINSVRFEENDGTIKTEEEVEQTWKVVKNHLDFNCPCCGYNNKAEIEGNIKNSSRYTCKDCDRRYFLYPKNGVISDKDVREMTIEEKIETQFKSVAKTYKIVDEYPITTTRTAHYPDNTLLASIAVVLSAIAAIITYISVGHLLDDNLPLLIYYSVSIASPSIGVVAIALGPGKYIYNNYKLYKKSDFEGSFYLYIMCMANYYHSKPFDLFR